MPRLHADISHLSSSGATGLGSSHIQTLSPLSHVAAQTTVSRQASGPMLPSNPQQTGSPSPNAARRTSNICDLSASNGIARNGIYQPDDGLSGTGTMSGLHRVRNSSEKQSTAEGNRLQQQYQNNARRQTVHQHENKVKELHDLKLEAEHLRELKQAQDLRKVEKAAERRKSQAVTSVGHSATIDRERMKFEGEVNRIHELHEKRKREELCAGWIVWMYRVRISQVFCGNLKAGLLHRKANDVRHGYAGTLQKAYRRFAERQQGHAAADVVKKFWNFRNTAVKKKYAVSKMMAFLSEGGLRHKWWLVASQIRMSACYLQGKIRQFLQIRRARIYVLSMAWYVAERRMVGGGKPVRSRFRANTLKEYAIRELEAANDEPLENEEGLVEGEINRMISKEDQMKRNLLLAKKEMKDQKAGFESRNAAHHLKKGAGEVKRKQKRKETKLMSNELSKFEKMELKVKEKQKKATGKGKITEQLSGRRPVKHMQVAMSKNGLASWVGSGGGEGKTFLKEFLNGSSEPGTIPEHLFVSDQRERAAFFEAILKRSRQVCNEKYADERGEWRANAEISRTGLKEFDVTDIKALFSGDLRLSQRKKTVRQSMFKRILRPSIMLYSEECAHVKFNAEVNACVRPGGKGPKAAEGATRMRLNSALDTSMFA